MWIAGQTLSQQAGALRTQEATSRGVRAVYQELSLVPGMSIAENMFLGTWPHRGIMLDHREMERRTGAAMYVVGLRLDPRREVSTLSTAERQMVEIARAVASGGLARILMDEPTAALNAEEVRAGSSRSCVPCASTAVGGPLHLAPPRRAAARSPSEVVVLRDGARVAAHRVAGVTREGGSSPRSSARSSGSSCAGVEEHEATGEVLAFALRDGRRPACSRP